MACHSIETWSYFRGDRVQILSGRDKGKQGIINQVIEERNWVFVEGLNCKLSTYGKKPDFPGIVIKEEMPLLVRKLAVHVNMNFCKLKLILFHSI